MNAKLVKEFEAEMACVVRPRLANLEKRHPVRLTIAQRAIKFGGEFADQTSQVGSIVHNAIREANQ